MDIFLYTIMWILIGIAKQCILMEKQTSISELDIDKLLIKSLKGLFS